jgi:hypothetical protein
MAANVTEASAYIALNCIDIEDWTEADVDKKLRLINVASRTLTKKYSTYTIPDNAVYEFACVLAVVFNDTNRYQQQGLSSLTVSGAASFDFKDSTVQMPGSDVAKYIPQSALDLISEENDGVKLAKRNIGWSVL